MDSYPKLGVQKADNDTTNFPSLAASEAVVHLWQQVIGDTKEASEFREAWTACEFNLGDELTQYNCFEGANADGNVLQIVCRGKVRLLAFDTSLGKEVSIQSLDANQIFGGDNAFCNQYREYRAVASSNGTLAQISLQHLDVWLQLYPALSDYFSQIVKSRQKLIFFKTLTQLRSQNTRSLQKLLPYFLESKVNAGSSLIAACPPDARFWLVDGKISSISQKNRSPVVGESWGYPHPIPGDFISQTDLSLFYLPSKHFNSIAETIPQLRNVEVDLSQEVNQDRVKQDYRVESQKKIQLEDTESEWEFIHEYVKFDNQHLNRRWFRIYPFIQQQSSSDCGAACLAMISQYWGKRFSIKTLRSIARINSMGAELTDLANAAQSLGYKALAVRGCLNQLESQVSPWIAHYQGNHYIVVWLIKNKSVMISDPAIGKLWVPLLEFEEKFTGYALLLYPTEKFFTNQNEKISFKRFYRFFANNRLLFAAIIFISIALGILGIVPAILAQTLIDIVTSTNNFDSINIFAFGFLVFGFGRIVLTAMRQYLVDNLSNRLNISLIGDFMSHILQLPLSFFTSRRAADIISKIQENPKIHRFLTRKAITTVLDGLMSIICFGLMAYYSLKLTLVVITFLWIVMGFLVVGNLFLKQIRRQYAFDSKEQNSVIVEIITGITTIKTENAENSLRSRWEEYFTQMVKTQKQGQNLTNIFQQANSLINHLGTTMVLWFGTQMVINSQISIGEFIAFNMLIGNTINPILALVKLWNEFPEILTSIEKLDDVLASETEAKIQKALTVLPSIRGEVRFENVSFGDTASIAEGNSQQGDILQNISFCVKQGQTIAIVGDNDSSKNALVKLLSGLYHPNKGRILIDGLDINQVTPDSLRSQLGVISQEFFLFSGTILENITLYNRNFSLEKVQSAAKRAGAHAFIEKLPLGYSTILGEGGIRLDAKQQRKLAIARALFKNPRILIIDEANNSLDSLCEYQFQQNLTCDNVAVIDTSFIKNTTFIVTPSLSSIHKADNILVFYRGILVDQGTHEELMTRSTIYPSLIQQQVDM